MTWGLLFLPSSTADGMLQAMSGIFIVASALKRPFCHRGVRYLAESFFKSMLIDRLLSSSFSR